MSKSFMYRFKDITTVPDAKVIVDIILSQTQRRTPTQVHPQFKISRIRSFYMRKVKYCQQAFHDKFTVILTEFPRLDDIHPFYADLCNVLYDRDHYKLALGQVNTVRGIVDRIAKDYVRLLKYADSPYKCKMLKRAALGRMCTAVRKLSDSLKYLEEVRQHLSRLPSINPNTRTLILTGYPNVGKSSFINLLTNANVEVQPYAFTTKSLYVGHFDHGYTRWQLIDTPGILDHPLANRNTIELTAITALAHIQAAVLFLLDLSEQCGFSIESQVSLFHNIKALFKSKPLVIVLNKSDLVKLQDLSPERQALIESMKEGHEDVCIIETSCLNSEGVDLAKSQACSFLLTRRVEAKINSNRVDAISNRLHFTEVTPMASRPPIIPDSVLKCRKAQNEQMLLRDLEEAEGGPGVFSVDLNNEWQLKTDDWKYDAVPEFFGSKNIMDFVDPDIEQKLLILEQEEEQLMREQFPSLEINDQDWQTTSKELDELMKKIQLRRIEKRLKTNHVHRLVPRTDKRPQSAQDAQDKLKEIGYEVEGLSAPLSTRQSLMTHLDGGGDLSDDEVSSISSEFEEPETKPRKKFLTVRKKIYSNKLARTKGLTGSGGFANAVQRAKSQVVTRLTKSLTKPQAQRAERVKRKLDRSLAIKGRAGEADRFIGTKMPKHLFSGKRGNGKTDRR